MGAVIDANTGKVYGFPHTICCWNDIQRDDKFSPIEFRINSRLVVFSGIRNEAEGDQGTHFYEFDGRHFKFIQSVTATSYEAPTATSSEQERIAYYSFGRIETPSYEQLTFQVKDGRRGEITYTGRPQ